MYMMAKLLHNSNIWKKWMKRLHNTYSVKLHFGILSWRDNTNLFDRLESLHVTIITSSWVSLTFTPWIEIFKILKNNKFSLTRSIDIFSSKSEKHFPVVQYEVGGNRACWRVSHNAFSQSSQDFDRTSIYYYSYAYWGFLLEWPWDKFAQHSSGIPVYSMIPVLEISQFPQ